MLTKDQINQYHRDGFLVIPDFSTPDEVKRLKNAGAALVTDFDPKSISVFSTRDQTKKTDQYFLDSANGVGFFFEEGAFDDSGNLTKPKHLALNKIGHAMHDLVPEFKQWARSENIATILRNLGYKRPLPVQSMFIFKQPGIGGEVVAHQDSSFLATDPPSVVGLWIALEDANQDNGCLWSLPGSHSTGVHKRFVRSADGSVSFDGDAAEAKYDTSAFVPIEVKAGSLVLLHGANVHCSKENLSSHSRHAFSVHYVEGAPGHTWAQDNWLQRKSEFPFEPLYDDTV